MQRPDGPKALPFLQLLQWIFQPLEYMDNCYKRYGDLFTVRFSGFPTSVFVCDPKAIEQIFAANPKTFDSGAGSEILRPSLGDNSLLLLDGDRHQRQRQLLMPPFHGERMRAYSQVIWHITDQVAGEWQVEQPFVMRSPMQEISLRVILQAVFGLDEGERLQQLRQLLIDFLKLTTSPVGSALAFFKVLQYNLGPLSPTGKFYQLKGQIDQLIYSEIQDRRSHLDPDRTDILSLLMATRDEAGQPMSDAELRDELITLLLAGHETTATALTWAFYWIHHLPEVKEKLLAELAPLNGELDSSTIVRLPYLNAFCSEVLRIYPIGLITLIRTVKTPFKLLDYELTPGMMLAPCIYLVHQREDLYPEPHQFKPERFLERQFSPYEFLPFGGGSRRCIGSAFSLFEMKLVLANILSNYRLALVDDRPIRPIRRGVTMAPEGGVPMILQEKYDRQSSSETAYSLSA
jgi:cytochrome P450 family 110